MLDLEIARSPDRSSVGMFSFSIQLLFARNWGGGGAKRTGGTNGKDPANGQKR